MRRCVGEFVSPGLQVGRGLKQFTKEQSEQARGVSPGLQVGRGLKQVERDRPIGGACVSPGLQVGRGLKQEDGRQEQNADDGIARPSGRAWIETERQQLHAHGDRCIARPSGRAWIETFWRTT